MWSEEPLLAPSPPPPQKKKFLEIYNQSIDYHYIDNNTQTVTKNIEFWEIFNQNIDYGLAILRQQESSKKRCTQGGGREERVSAKKGVNKNAKKGKTRGHPLKVQ
jgi:hypothetical protein